MIIDTTTATPQEIDAELSRINGEIASANARITQLDKLIDHYSKSIYDNDKALSEAQANVRKLVDRVQDLTNEANVLHTEFKARGGWTRAFLVVTSGQGHVHRTMACTTCYSTTEFMWITELSDHDEQEIVDAAGERACTVCYASAPVALRLDRPTAIFSEDEKRKQAERQERAAKASQKATEAVVDAETGKVLFKTVRGATNALSAALDSMVHYGPSHPSFKAWQAEVETTRKALEAKGVEWDYEATLAKVRKKKIADHKKFMKSAMAASYRAQGLLDPFVDSPEYDPNTYPVKF